MIVFGALYTKRFDANAAVERLDEHLIRMSETRYCQKATILNGPSFISYNLELESSTDPQKTIISRTLGYFDSQRLESGEYLKVSILSHHDEYELDGLTDAFSSMPLFTYQNGAACAISNDIFAIAKFFRLKKLDLKPTYSLFITGHCITRETTIAEVKRLWPSERITFRLNATGSITTTLLSTKPLKYRERRTSIEIHAIQTFKSLVDGCRRILANKQEFVLQLSGGLDSRITAGAIRQAFPDLEIQTCTVDIATPSELEAAGRSATVLRLKHSIERLGIFAEDVSSAFLLTGGQVSVLAAATNLHMYRRGNPESVTQIVGAWPGDTLIGSYVPNHPGFLRPDKTVRAIRRWALNKARLSRYLARVIFGRRNQKYLERSFGRQLFEILLECSGENAAQKISYWAMFRRQPAFSFNSPARLTDSVIELTPMLHLEYVENLLELRGDEIFKKNFYRKMLFANLPSLAAIPYNEESLSKEFVVPCPGIRERLLYDFPTPVLRSLVWLFDRLSVNLQFSRNSEIRKYAELARKFELHQDTLSAALDNQEFQVPIFDFTKPVDVDRFWKLLTIQMTQSYLNEEKAHD